LPSMRAWRLIALAYVISRGSEVPFEPFLQWLREHRAVLQAGLTLGVDKKTKLRGIVCNEPIAKGEPLAVLPASLVLTAEIAREQGAAWQQCSSDGAGVPEVLAPTHTSLALLLLEHRAMGSAWAPWVAVLPDAFPGFPLFFTEEELEGLQASPLRRVIELDRSGVAHDHGIVAKAWADLTLEEFKWARTAVKSRVFGLKSLSRGALEQEIIAMVPFADFVNHPPDGVVEANVEPFYDAKTGAFSLVAVRGISRGEGLYWDYGFGANRHSLVRYGFTSQARIGLTTMPLFFKLDPAPSGASSSLKADLIAKAQKAGDLTMEEDGTVLHMLELSLTSATAEKLLGHMRFLVLQPRDAPSLEASCSTTYCRPISLGNERRALHRLAGVLTDLVESYGTSVDEDRSILDGGQVRPGNGTHWHTFLVRYGEKKVLHGFIRLLKTLDGLFDLSPWGLGRAVAEQWNSSKSDIHRYVQVNLTALLDAETLRWAKRRVKELKKTSS